MLTGLSRKKASELLLEVGYNELPVSRSKGVLRIALESIKEPMILLLIAGGALYMVLGDYSEGVILLAWIFVIIAITFYQQQKTEKALEALKRLSSPRALVIRDGEEVRIAGREVVPGDLVILHEGDRVPADGTLIRSTRLTIDEAILTGESVPVQKTSESREDQSDKAFSGTLVVRGRGTMRVSATGIKTEFGKIGHSLMGIEKTPTRLQAETGILVRNLFIIGALLSTVVALGFYLTRGHLLPAILNGLATAMAMLPEEFPVVLTVFMAIGAWRLSRNHVLTRDPRAIETLGSATVLCSDKTGTITQNKMKIVSIVQGEKILSDDLFQSHGDQIEEIIEISAIASSAETVEPMEKAIRNFYGEMNKGKALPDITREYPLSEKLMAMSCAVRKENGYFIGSKGAPEAILELCRMDPEEREAALAKVQELAKKGQRLLGVAKAEWNHDELPAAQEDFDFQFLGLLGFEDPIRPEVPAAIEECYRAGIKVIMITGDYPSTARSIARQSGMDVGASVITGDQLSSMSDDQLTQKIRTSSVFARIVPEQKLRIVRALKANDEVVAMTGDGVNDAPALKAADIGIAMGGRGTDVARESASLVLLDDNFSSIVSAIRQGRRIYDNLQKAMTYIIAIHVPIIGLTLLPAFIPELPIILMPLHIVFLELIIDPVCSIAFESEEEEKGIMERPPRESRELFFDFRKISGSVSYGILLLGLVIGVYFMSIQEGHTDGEVRAIAFSSLIIGNIFLILTTLSRTRTAFHVLLERNVPLLTVITSATIILVLLIMIPYLREIFSLEHPGFYHFVISLAGAGGMLIVLEVIKYIRNRGVTIV